MTYLIFKILLFIAIALVVGYWLGSSVYRARFNRLTAESEVGDEAAQEKLGQLEEELSTTRIALKGESQGRETAERRVGELESSTANQEERINAAIARAEALEESLDKERQVLTESDAALRELREAHQKTLHTLQETEGELQGLLKAQDDASSEDEHRQTEIEVLVRDRDTWQSDAQNALRRISQLEEEVLAARTRAEGAEEERRALSVQCESYERRTEEMVLRSNAQTEALAEKDARIRTLEAQLSDAPPAELAELPALNEAGFYASRPREVDDLKLINGVGPKLEGLLHTLGIYQYQQIALMTSGQVAWVNEQLSFKGRIERDNWIKQAALLAGIAAPASEQSA